MQDLEAHMRVTAGLLANLRFDARIVDVDNAFREASAQSILQCEHFGRDLPSAAIALTKNACDVDDVVLVDPRRNNLTGLSGLPLFFAKARGQVITTIKAFPESSALGAQTLWAADNLYRITARCPRLLAVGKTVHGGQNYLLIASEYLPGELINDRIIAMAGLPEGRVRNEALHSLCRIIFKLGTFLGTLHTEGPNFHGPEQARVKDQHEQAFLQTMRGLSTAPELAIDQARLASSMQKIMDDMAHHEYRYAYGHGDAHPGNYLYNSDEDRVVALDLDAGAKTIGANLEPLGSPFTDYIKITASLKIREIFGVKIDESLAIRQAFDAGYSERGAKIPSERLANYYTVMEVFDYAAWYFKHVHHLAPDVKPLMHQILLTGMGWLQNALEDAL